MSYQVLARKWRPKNFSELMGQEHVVSVLSNALNQQRLHHAYLFTGTRGVGKTTIARIFAKSLNCEQGISASPCGKCDTCLDIDAGRYVDLLEIDAASRTKVDDTREILDNVQYAPTRGQYKVYLIDEVHMLSKSSFNALLKTLEEPPEHVKFILATTDPQKLPVTVLSRCLQFHLKALSVKQIEEKLTEILSAESVEIDPTALTLLAKAARGSMRDSLSLTDQAIAQGQGNITATNLQQMLGGIDRNWVYKILILLIKQDSAKLMELSLQIASYAPNYSRLMAELIQLLHQIALTQVVGTHFDLQPEHNTLLEKFCQSLSPEDVQLYYQIVLNGRKDLPYAADEQAAFDMVLLRLLAFQPQRQANTTVTVVESAESSLADFDDFELAIETPVEKTQVNTRTAAEQTVEPAVESVLEPIENQASTISHQGSLQKHVEDNDPSLENSAIDDVSDRVESHHEEASDQASLLHQEVAELEQSAEALKEQKPVIFSESIEQPTQVSNFQTVETKPEAEQGQVEKSVPEPIQPVEVENTGNPDINQVLANRNMLRSQKQALEKDGKKSKDADQRQEKNEIVREKPKDVPELDSLPQQPFSDVEIDPSVVKKANQVDKWANIIDAMALNGRLRQLALNATLGQSEDEDHFLLLLNQSTKHLRSENAFNQLQEFVSEYFERPMRVEIRVVEETIDDPAQIQGKINEKRYEYAQELLAQDEIVVALQDKFQAELSPESIEAL